MSEGDDLNFGESDAWRRCHAEEAAAELLPRPAWQAPVVTMMNVPQNQQSSLLAAVEPGRQLCCVLDVVAQAVAPVKKLCDVVGVELVLLSSALLTTVEQLLGRSSGMPALPASGSDRHGVQAGGEAGGERSTLISVQSADSAGRAISHVLDASLQRVGKKGRVLVDINGGCEAKVEVLIADTGTQVLAELMGDEVFGDDSSGGTPSGQSAQDAIERVSIGLPVGSGVMGMRIAERLLRENGASVAVGSWMFDDEEYVRTTVTFQAGEELNILGQ